MNCKFSKKVLMMVVGFLLLSSSVYAETASDFRVKLGSAAQLTKLSDVSGSLSGTGSDSGNFQIEGNWGMYNQSNFGFIFNVGIFSRQHSGKILTTTIDYDAAGLSLGAGVGYKASNNLHFEGKLEIGMGQGKPTLTTPGVIWNATESGTYTSASLILGAYYTFSNPGFQIGLELGSQSFKGEFTVARTGGGSSPTETVEGTSGTVNLVLGYRF